VSPPRVALRYFTHRFGPRLSAVTHTR